MRALVTFVLVVLILLAACFTYAHRALYQKRFENALREEAERALHSNPDFSRVTVSFKALSANLGGTVTLPKYREQAQRRVNAIPGARAIAARNAIQVIPTLRIEQRPDGGYQGVGWLPPGDWRERASAIFAATAPQIRIDLTGVQPDPSVLEPTFLNQPQLPEFLHFFFITVTNGQLDLDNTHVRMGGKVHGEAERQRLLTLAGQAMGPTAEVSLANDFEVMPPIAPARGVIGGAADGNDLLRLLRSYPIYFDTGSSSVKGEEAAKVDQLAMVMKKLSPTGRFVVGGHADSSGNPTANQALSLRRAEAVAAQLAARGVPRRQLEVRAFADKQGGPNSSAAEGKRQSRRVEIWPK